MRRSWVALRTWLEVRMLPAQILRGRLSAEEILLLTLLGLIYFLCHWEEIYWASDDNLFLLPFDKLPETVQPWLWLPAVLSIPLNSWWLDRWIRRETGLDSDWLPALLWFRRALCGIPILGLAAIPLWFGLMRARPRWAVRSRPAPELVWMRPDSRPTASRRRHRALLPGLSPAIFVPLGFVINSALLRAAATALIARPTPWSDGLVVATAVGLRLVGLTLQLTYVRMWSLQRGQGTAVWLAQALVATGWLLPIRLSYVLTFLAIVLVERRWQETLSSKATARRSAPPTSGAGLWKWVFGGDAKRKISETLPLAESRRKVGRIKMFALMLEAAVLAWLVLRVSQLEWLGFSKLVAQAVFLAGLALVAIEPLRGLVLLCLAAWGLGSRQPRRHGGGQQVWSHFLRFSAVFVGVALGGLLDSPIQAGIWLGRLGPALVVASLVVLVVQMVSNSVMGRRLPVGFRIPWLLVFAFMAALGNVIAGAPEHSPAAQRVAVVLLWTFVLAAPLVGHALALRHLSPMLWPFRKQDLFDPELPFSARWRLAWVAAATILPLGGLAIPFSQGFSRRLRVEFDHFWSRSG